MAQPGSAPVLGTGGRKFESYRPDHFLKQRTKQFFLIIWNESTYF